MNEVLTLIKKNPDSSRTVFCSVRSVGMKEFYQASATDFHPEITFVLADYLEYENEKLADHNGTRYRIMRTYRKGQELELVAERADAEDGEANG